MAIVLLFYNFILELIYLLCLPVLLPYLAYRKYLGAIHPSLRSVGRPVLIHAASVGEMNALKTLIGVMLDNVSPEDIIITNTNINALPIGKSINPKIRSELAVLDIFHLRYRQLKQINPRLICVMETEIWPNLLLVASLLRIPVIFLNARITAKSQPRYQALSTVLRYAGRSVIQVNCQTREDADRFQGVFNCPVAVSGNLKFIPGLPEYDLEESKAHWKLKQDELVLVFGSSRPGEEELVLQLWPGLKQRFPQLKLFIAPRHVERRFELEKLCSSLDFSMESRSEVVRDLHFIDQLGLLSRAYSICDLAIVGGSFMDYGGHNPLEPAFYGKAIIIGPYHKSCKESVHKLADAGALVLSDRQKLGADIENLLNNPSRRKSMGLSAKNVLKQNSQALEKHLESIKAWL